MYKVLIVDDDKTVRYILKRYKNWAFYGFTIEDEACDGKEALKKLASSRFDLIITDIKMPGMDGIELLTEIKNMKYDISIMIMSTYSDFEYAKQGMRLGALDYMIKPLNDDVLDEALQRIKEFLDRKYLDAKKDREVSKKLEESLELYYPKNHEKKLVSLLLTGDIQVMAEAEETFAEISSVFEKDTFKTGIMIENMLLKLWEEICASSSQWLGKIEKMDFEGMMTDLDSLIDVKEKFLGCVGEMLEIVKKYELHQNDSLVRKICDYVLNHIEDNINLEKISQEVHVSKDYIGKIFKQKTGGNFNEYTTKVKMEHAKYLLRSGDYKNYEISEKLGYSSPDYFCRLFKNYTGYTPREFRKKYSMC